MSSSILTLHVGQCGNQIGVEFWRRLFEEHGIGDDGKSKEFDDKSPEFERARRYDKRSAFFYEADDGHYVPRAVIVDLEPRVVNKIARGELGKHGALFNPENVYQSDDGGGAGNRWFDGYERGRTGGDVIMDMVRREAENADRMEGVLMTHSVSGGTGSGMGSFLLESIRDNFPKMAVQSYSVFPNPHQPDVVVGPYNTICTLDHLAKYTDSCVVMDNGAMSRIVSDLKIPNSTFEHMNGMISSVMGAATAPIRFYNSTYNSLRSQIVELTPFRPYQFVQPAYVPFNLPDSQRRYVKTSVSDTLTRLFKPSSWMATTRDTDSHFLFGGMVLFQGEVSDLHEHFESAIQRRLIRYPDWSGIRLAYGASRSSPYVRQTNKVSGLLLANHTNITTLFEAACSDFDRMLRSRANLHHSTTENYTKEDIIEQLHQSREVAAQLIDSYNELREPNYLELQREKRRRQQKENLKPDLPSSDLNEVDEEGNY